jgi:hypothetical protein
MNRKSLYLFSEIPHWKDYFAGIREWRNEVRQALNEMLAPRIRQEIHHYQSPIVSIHVRRGDFRELRSGEDFAQVGLVRTPTDYFKSIIISLRHVAGCTLPVTLFSDGSDGELDELLRLGDVHRHRPAAAITDLLLMSRSKVVVASAGSTFGYWAGFLSDAPLILHPDHIHAPIRPPSVNTCCYEGSAVGEPDNWPRLLRDNLRAISAAC